ncbi:peptidase M17 leucyl aminopeptidase domain protein [Pyrolobus fumarii 1A]|uniref:Probable cytosol aminopeptidase n=1 Tax=Pyrolobus fumarii (strain DSM 11204 / 1A) TaxID=694429 RepID=G0ECB4_PYRF1|nr:leucyl aminopeptidase [Pyrolobus fumarii]AEM39484.1 peptidase M17 leucyl aminopeptidase domain protein [Pyrolobus fumarii 1A]
MTRLVSISTTSTTLYDAIAIITNGPIPQRLSLPREAHAPIELGDFRGRLEEVRMAYMPGKPPRVIYAGVDAEWPPELIERLRMAVASAVSYARGYRGISRLAVAVADGLVERATSGDRGVEWVYEQLVVAADMANYVYTQKSRGIAPHVIEEVGFVDAPERSLETGRIIAEAVRVARDFANAPSSEMNPEGVERLAAKLASEYGLRLRVLRARELEEHGMNGILAVGRGSSVEPRLVILEYNGGPRSIAIVGKTVTFDSGGLFLKSSDSMLDMKYDKSGGGIALGAILAAARLQLPVTVYALLPAVENMPGGSAYKPRDVLKMYGGYSVEVLSTDAEGRLTLADALSYAARELKADILVDVATLTGAAVVALGNHAAALFSNNDRLAEVFERLARFTGEYVWRMPLWPVYERQLESTVADMANTGGRPGAAIVAAKFLEKFVDDKPWLHLDIAGVAWVQDRGPKKPYYESGATAWGLRAIIELLRDVARGATVID